MSGKVKFVVIAIVALVLVSVGVTVFVLMDNQSSEPASSGDTVRIEVRAMPRMDITKDGKDIGKTPMSFVAKKSTTPITLEARWTETYFSPTGASKKVHKRKVQTIVPDHSMTVDFTRTPLAGSATE